MENDEKKYFTIGEVADKLGVATSAIRFWESEFQSELRISRTSHGRRVYTRENIEKLSLICHLIRDRGLRIEAAREAMRSKGNAAERHTRIIQRLETLKTEIQELADSLSRIQTHTRH